MPVTPAPMDSTLIFRAKGLFGWMSGISYASPPGCFRPLYPSVLKFARVSSSGAIREDVRPIVAVSLRIKVG